jgi:hypothetical protein
MKLYFYFFINFILPLCLTKDNIFNVDIYLVAVVEETKDGSNVIKATSIYSQDMITSKKKEKGKRNSLTIPVKRPRKPSRANRASAELPALLTGATIDFRYNTKKVLMRRGMIALEALSISNFTKVLIKRFLNNGLGLISDKPFLAKITKEEQKDGGFYSFKVADEVGPRDIEGLLTRIDQGDRISFNNIDGGDLYSNVGNYELNLHISNQEMRITIRIQGSKEEIKGLMPKYKGIRGKFNIHKNQKDCKKIKTKKKEEAENLIRGHDIGEKVKKQEDKGSVKGDIKEKTIWKRENRRSITPRFSNN